MKANRAFCAPMTRRNAQAKQLLELLPPIVGWSQPSGGEQVFTVTLRHEFTDKSGDDWTHTLSIHMNRAELSSLMAGLQTMLNNHPEESPNGKLP